MTADDLRAFESEVAAEFEAAAIRAPVHLSGGNEERLIQIFERVEARDWVFCSYRGHYHALLKGVPADEVKAAILAGRSMTLCFPEHRFYSSAIVAGHVPMAVGVAAGLKRDLSVYQRVWCFVGDMAAETGIFHEAVKYAQGHALPIRFVIEDNGLSAHSPTAACWGSQDTDCVESYRYDLPWPHVNSGKWVNF